MSGASAHLSGEHCDVPDAPTARRNGAGFRTWLRSVAPDALGPSPASARSQAPAADRLPNASASQRVQPSENRSPEPDRDLSALAYHLKDVTRRLGRLIAGEAPQPRPASAEEAPDLAAIERHLKFLTTQLEIMRSPCRADALIAELRGELATIARVLETGVSRGAFASLEDEVRALGARLDTNRCAAADASAFAALEHGLGELRDALHGLAPGELGHAVQTLSRKIDQIGELVPDPLTFRELDKAIDALRGIVSQIASGDALSALVKEVRAIGAKIEKIEDAATRANTPARSIERDILAAMEKQLSGIADTLSAESAQPARGSAPVEPLIETLAKKLETFDLFAGSETALAPIKQHISQLEEKIERLQPPSPPQPAIDPIEERLRALVETLDRFEKNGFPRAAGSDAQPPHAVDDDASQPDLAQAHESDRPSEQGPTPPAAAPAAGQTTAALALPALSLTPAAAAKPEAAPQVPPEQAADADTSLPPDAPIEPGSGPPPRGRSARSPHRKTARSSAGPIASERVSRPPFRSNFIVAARRAAQAANEPNDPRSDASAPVADADPGVVSQKLAERVKTMFVSTSLVLVGLGAAGIALSSADLIGLGGDRLAAASRSAPIAQVALPAMPPSRLPATSETATAPSIMADPFAIVTPFPRAPQASPDAPPTRFATPRTPAETVEATGSIGSQGNGSRAAASSAGRSWSEMLPAPMATKPLLAGIAERNPAAAYEIGMRYVEGRGVPSDLALAAVWFARAAEGGLALAQFRLGSMYEKGLGVKRNPSEARRLYFAAAAQGHAVAMHNIAVLYAEGIDGKPDFTQAAEWFQKAAKYGVGDSQFNLAVLYARGSGVEQNLVESFKWFSIAADKGDKDAAAKRDEIALHLDPETIAETRSAASAFVPKPQPQEATTAPTPPDGWDDADPAKPKPRTGNLYRRVQRA